MPKIKSPVKIKPRKTSSPTKRARKHWVHLADVHYDDVPAFLQPHHVSLIYTRQLPRCGGLERVYQCTSTRTYNCTYQIRCKFPTESAVSAQVASSGVHCHEDWETLAGGGGSQFFGVSPIPNRKQRRSRGLPQQIVDEVQRAILIEDRPTEIVKMLREKYADANLTEQQITNLIQRCKRQQNQTSQSSKARAPKICDKGTRVMEAGREGTPGGDGSEVVELDDVVNEPVVGRKEKNPKNALLTSAEFYQNTRAVVVPEDLIAILSNSSVEQLARAGEMLEGAAEIRRGSPTTSLLFGRRKSGPAGGAPKRSFPGTAATSKTAEESVDPMMGLSKRGVAAVFGGGSGALDLSLKEQKDFVQALQLMSQAARQPVSMASPVAPPAYSPHVDEIVSSVVNNYGRPALSPTTPGPAAINSPSANSVQMSTTDSSGPNSPSDFMAAHQNTPKYLDSGRDVIRQPAALGSQSVANNMQHNNSRKRSSQTLGPICSQSSPMGASPCDNCQVLRGQLVALENRNKFLCTKATALATKIERREARIAKLEANARLQEEEGLHMQNLCDAMETRMVQLNEHIAAHLAGGVLDDGASNRRFLQQLTDL